MLFPHLLGKENTIRNDNPDKGTETDVCQPLSIADIIRNDNPDKGTETC